MEPHLLAGDVLHLGEIGAETLDEVRLAGSGAAAPVRRAGEEGLRSSASNLQNFAQGIGDDAGQVAAKT